MVEQGLRLTVYLGERDRSSGGLLAAGLMDLFERHGVRTSVLLRGIEGFGLRHRVQSDRLLSLSEDLPIVAVAVDRPERIEATLADVERLTHHGLITLERVGLLRPGGDLAALAPAPGASRLTVNVGRGHRVRGRPAHLAVIECLHGHGLDGASVLVGLDGMDEGRRRRARLLENNRQVPLVIDGVGRSERVLSAAVEIAAMLPAASMALERVTVCKRDGVRLSGLPPSPAEESGGLSYWQKVVVQAGEQSRHESELLHGALVRRLRAEGAAGATTLRGHWGFYGEHRPHGERFWSITRQVPALTVVLDTPANMRRWFDIVDEMTAHTGLVTCEHVPALRASGPDVVHGGLRLAAAAGEFPQKL